MNRRDTIIIAVLLNAGLLIVLFATSLKSDKTEEAAPPVSVLSSNQLEPTPVTIPQSTPVAAVPSVSSTDQVDQVIQQFVPPQVTGQGDSQQPNFLADLQALVTQESLSPVRESASAVALESEPAYREVKVKKVYVLDRIARQNYISVDDLMKANKLSSSRLKIGQTLK